MSLLRTDRSWREEVRHRVPVRYLPQTTPDHLRGTWRDAKPARIDAALAAALRRPTHGWLVAAASADVPTGRTLLRTVAGREVVLWRDGDGTLARRSRRSAPTSAPGSQDCDVVEGTVLCRWHGMPLGRDDPLGRLDDLRRARRRGPRVGPPRRGRGRRRADRPTRCSPPARRSRSRSPRSSPSPPTCEPRDIVANRLDPWHGAWLHPYAFSDLAVDDLASTDDRLVLDVAYRLGRTFAVPVRAEFTCPDSHTIVMTITDGEGTGSVVETHATPLTGAG